MVAFGAIGACRRLRGRNGRGSSSVELTFVQLRTLLATQLCLDQTRDAARKQDPSVCVSAASTAQQLDRRALCHILIRVCQRQQQAVAEGVAEGVRPLAAQRSIPTVTSPGMQSAGVLRGSASAQQPTRLSPDGTHSIMGRHIASTSAAREGRGTVRDLVGNTSAHDVAGIGRQVALKTVDMVGVCSGATSQVQQCAVASEAPSRVYAAAAGQLQPQHTHYVIPVEHMNMLGVNMKTKADRSCQQTSPFHQAPRTTELLSGAPPEGKLQLSRGKLEHIASIANAQPAVGALQVLMTLVIRHQDLPPGKLQGPNSTHARSPGIHAPWKDLFMALCSLQPPVVLRVYDGIRRLHPFMSSDRLRALPTQARHWRRP